MSNVLFQANNLPVLQNTTFATPGEARATAHGDVVLALDPATGLIHNSAFDPDKLVYDANYNNEQSFSNSFRAHLDDVANIIRRHFSGVEILEIGCGKGAFLNQLKAAGFSIRGVDPAYTGSDPDVVKALFSPALGLRADAIILRHVLEHIANPHEFLQQVSAANGGEGLIYIEVPCFEWTCARKAWFDIFYEHVNYFRLADFQNMFSGIKEIGRLFDDQYIYVVADLATLRTGQIHPTGNDPQLHELAGHRAYWQNPPRRTRAIWGAASKGVIFAKQLQQYGVGIEMAIDINPAKQGRYLPASALYVASPQEALARLPAGAEIIVMNSRYLGEIKSAGGHGFSYRTIEAES